MRRVPWKFAMLLVGGGVIGLVWETLGGHIIPMVVLCAAYGWYGTPYTYEEQE